MALYLYLGRVCERGQKKNVPPMSARRRGDLGGAELEHQELLELPRRRRTAARTRQTGSTGRARGAAALQGRPAAPATAPRRRAPATQHSTAASWASPTAEGACRAGTRPRACGVASRTPAHPVVTARRPHALPHPVPARGPRGLPVARGRAPAEPSPHAAVRGLDAREHTACGPPSAARPPPPGREGLGRGSPPGQARHGRARHGPARTRVRVRPSWV